MKRPVALSTVLLVSAALATAQDDHAAGPSESGQLDEMIRTAAVEVVKIIKDKTVSVGQITPTNLPDANSGPMIEESLRRAIDTISPGKVQRTAPFSIKGDIALKPHPAAAEARAGQKAIRLTFRLIDNDTDEDKAINVTRFVRDNSSITRILGVSGPLPLDASKKQDEQKRARNQAIQDLAANPRTAIDPASPTVVRSAVGSPFGVEIVAGPVGDGSARPTSALLPAIRNGLAFVEVDRGQVYEIKVHNASPDEMAVSVFIDGLDVFHFSDDRDPADSSKPRFSRFVIAPGTGGKAQVVAIPGWHKSVGGRPGFLGFQVMAYGEGASSKAGIPATGPIGVIQVQFSRCYPRLSNGRNRSPSNETGFGPPRDIKQEPVSREIEPPIDVVSVRYTR